MANSEKPTDDQLSAASGQMKMLFYLVANNDFFSHTDRDEKLAALHVVFEALEEVKRLRVENPGLAQLSAAKIFYGFPGGERERQTREVVRAVARGEAVWYDEVGQHCGFCDVIMDRAHADGCPVTKARAILAD